MQYPLFAYDWCIQLWLCLLTLWFSMYYSYSCITNCGTRCSRLGSLSPYNHLALCCTLINYLVLLTKSRRVIWTIETYCIIFFLFVLFCFSQFLCLYECNLSPKKSFGGFWWVGHSNKAQDVVGILLCCFIPVLHSGIWKKSCCFPTIFLLC